MKMASDVQPLYLKHSELSKHGDTILAIHICNAVTRVTNARNLEGVQKINNLWLIFFNDKATRLEVYNKGDILISGNHYSIYDENPYTSFQTTQNAEKPPNQQIIKNDKLTIRNVPMWVDNTEVKTMLESHSIKLVSTIRYGMVRDEDGQLTSFKNGERFVYVKPFDPPIPRRQQIGDHYCTIIHHGKEIPCIACNIKGHRIGDKECIAKPKSNKEILAFKGYLTPLSNHYTCDLNVFNNDFKSVEHAFYWKMAHDMGKEELAADIKSAKHAGIVKRISKGIASDEDRFLWEKENVGLMEELLEAKANQCEDFKALLLHNREKIFAEATFRKFWGTGASEFVSANTDPEYWPGQNMLGCLLNDLRDNLLKTDKTNKTNEEIIENFANNNRNEAVDDHEASNTQTKKILHKTSSVSQVQHESHTTSTSQKQKQKNHGEIITSHNSREQKPSQEDHNQPQNKKPDNTQKSAKQSMQPRHSSVSSSKRDQKNSCESSGASHGGNNGDSRRGSTSNISDTRGRSKKKSPAKHRTLSSSFKGKGKKELFMDIQTAFDNKRKTMASSPTEEDKAVEPLRKKDNT